MFDMQMVAATQCEMDGYCGLTGDTVNAGPPEYESLPAPFETRYCESPKLAFYERPITPSHACVVDGSEYTAKLITGPEFGCVNHEVS